MVVVAREMFISRTGKGGDIFSLRLTLFVRNKIRTDCYAAPETRQMKKHGNPTKNFFFRFALMPTEVDSPYNISNRGIEKGFVFWTHA